MGVQNFWQLIESTGRPVNMNKGLEGKILAIDISIWLHQAAKGMRDRQNPHILLLLHRICKLLHFKIKPIFVFDGGVPELKRRTLAERRQRRDVAENKAKEAKSKIRMNYLKMIAIQQLRGEEVQSLPSAPVDDSEKDLFELPDTHLRAQLVGDENEEDQDDEIIETNEMEPVVKHQKQRTTWSRKRPDHSSNYHYVLPKFSEIDDESLNNLPVDMQHEILTEMKESLKRGKHQEDDLPEKSDDFSAYQVQKLLKQNSVSQKIISLNKAIKRQRFDIPTGSNAKIYAGKLASDASTQYILIKSDTEPKPAAVKLAPVSSMTPPSFNRRSTSDFCANDMMNRDPVSGLTQRRSLTNDEQGEVKLDVQEEPKIEAEQSVEKSVVNLTEENDDEERAEIELAIRISLENQPEPVVEQDNNHLSDVAESSSDSDDGDFIIVPMKPRSSEPILLPSDDESADIVETSNNTANTTTSELDLDESSEHSTAIEDIKALIDNDKEQAMTSDVEPKESSISQIEALDRLQAELMDDTAAQSSKARANERLTATLNDTMHEETQYLLRLFGIPYIVSPTEAEAQCAYLDLSHQCDGVITDDSDVWLFGSTHVYRHFFRQNQLVEYYDSTIITNQLGLDRETMIAIGMIVGSDYTKGIPNAGIMTALEILQEFHGTCMERLEKFRRWWKRAQRPEYTTQSKTLKRLKNLELFEGFPNQAVYDAYLNPKINPDQSKFTWAMPQLELLREFIGSKLKWDRRKIDDMILPVIKRMNTKELQSRIDSFFAPALFDGGSSQLRKNTRLKSALDLLKEKTREAKELDNGFHPSDDDDEDITPIPERNQPKKRKRTRNNTQLINDVLDVAKKTKRRAKKTNNIAPPNLSEDETS